MHPNLCIVFLILRSEAGINVSLPRDMMIKLKVEYEIEALKKMRLLRVRDIRQEIRITAGLVNRIFVREMRVTVQLMKPSDASKGLNIYLQNVAGGLGMRELHVAFHK